MWNFEEVVSAKSLGFCVSFFAEEEWSPFSSDDLLQGIHAFGVDRISCHNHDYGHLLIDQGQGTVLQFSGKDTLTVHIRQFFDFLELNEECNNCSEGLSFWNEYAIVHTKAPSRQVA